MSAEDLTPRLEAVEHDVADLKKAFPSGDVEGHRRYHELMIEKIESQRRLTQAIKEKTISGLVWSAIVAIAYAIVQYIRNPR